MELQDLYAARYYAAYYNVHRKEDMAPAEIRDFLMFPPEITPERAEEIEAEKVEALGAKVDAIFKRWNAKGA